MSFARRIVLALVVLALVLVHAGSARADDPTEVRLLMDWFAQADQAGFWRCKSMDWGSLPRNGAAGRSEDPTIRRLQPGRPNSVSRMPTTSCLRVCTAPGPRRLCLHGVRPVRFGLSSRPGIKSLTDLKDKTFAVNLGFGYWNGSRNATASPACVKSRSPET